MRQRNALTIVSAEDMRRIQSLHDPVTTLSRREILTIQYVKLVNYFRDDVSQEWGGGSNEQDIAKIEFGLQRFLEDVDAYSDANLPRWLCKKFNALPWGSENFELCSRANFDLGYPYEAYLTINDSILTIQQASRILSIDSMELIRVKCSLLIDRKVVAYAIKEMLKPRPLWPRIRLKRGGKGRSYRFA